MAVTIMLWKAIRSFYTYITCKKKIRKKVGLLPNRAGDPVSKA